MTILIAKTKSSEPSHGYISLGSKLIPCVFGRNGVTYQKREGDGCTPKGHFRLLKVFYKPGVVVRPNTTLPVQPLHKNYGWCDDPESTMYNKLVKIPFDASYEKLWRSDKLYNYIVVLDFNIRPVIKGKGSAIFFHVAAKDFTPTEGCIAVSEKHILQILEYLDSNSTILIN